MFRCEGVPAKSQTELEFIYSLWSREGSQCRGPLVSLTLRNYALKEVLAALDLLDASDVLLRMATEPVTETDGKFQMCAAHWYDVTQAVAGMAEAKKQPIWDQLSASLFMIVSRASGWDFREMRNRFTSLNQARMAGNK